MNWDFRDLGVIIIVRNLARGFVVFKWNRKYFFFFFSAQFQPQIFTIARRVDYVDRGETWALVTTSGPAYTHDCSFFLHRIYFILRIRWSSIPSQLPLRRVGNISSAQCGTVNKKSSLLLKKAKRIDKVHSQLFLQARPLFILHINPPLCFFFLS